MSHRFIIPTGSNVLIREANYESRGCPIMEGEVLAWGPDVLGIRSSVKVIFNRNACEETSLTGERLIIIAEKDILGTIGVHG